MNLNCPQCGTEDTKKLSLVMNEGGLAAKGARFGAFYVYNIWIPVATVFFGIAFGVVFAMMNGYLGFAVFLAILFAGYTARKWVKAKTKSKHADLSADMKQNGFQCNRCEHLFIPGAAPQVSVRAEVPPMRAEVSPMRADLPSVHPGVCRRCGGQLLAGARFCTACGQSIS